MDRHVHECSEKKSTTVSMNNFHWRGWSLALYSVFRYEVNKTLWNIQNSTRLNKQTLIDWQQFHEKIVASAFLAVCKDLKVNMTQTTCNMDGIKSAYSSDNSRKHTAVIKLAMMKIVT